MKADKRDVQFFKANAGYYRKPGESKAAAMNRSARRLATAEAEAINRRWHWEWEVDECGCTGCGCGSEDCDCAAGYAHETLQCTLKDGDRVLASLGGICGATASYRRVVEAELALEAMARPA